MIMDDERKIVTARFSANKDWTNTPHRFRRHTENADNDVTDYVIIAPSLIEIEAGNAEPAINDFISRAIAELSYAGISRKFVSNLSQGIQYHQMVVRDIEILVNSEVFTVNDFQKAQHKRIFLDRLIEIMYLDMRKALRHAQLEDRFEEDLKLYEFFLCRTLCFEVGGIGLKDIFATNPTKIDIGKVVMFSQHAGRSLPQNTSTEELALMVRPYIDPKYQDLSIKYPATLVQSQLAIYNFFNICRGGNERNHIRENIPNPVHRMLAGNINSATKRIGQINHRIYQSFVDKEDPYHNSVVETYREVLANGNDRQSILYLIGVDTDIKLIDVYRAGQEFLKVGHNTDVFEEVKKTILMIFEDNPVSLDILEVEDLEMIFDTDTESSTDRELLINQLRLKVKELFSLVSVRKSDIPTNAIEWRRLVEPSAMTLSFDSENPKIMFVEYKYISDHEDRMTFNYSIDLRKEFILNWNCLESSENDTPEITRATDICIENVLQALSYLIAEARIAKSQKQAVSFDRKKETPKRERGNSEVYLLRKEKPDISTDQVDAPVIDQNEDDQLCHEIEIDYQLLEKDLRQLSEVDIEAVKRDIEDYNNRGVGKFKKLKSRGREGQKLYSFRVDCTTRAGVRVLLEDVRSTETTTRIFRAISVGYRKDIYRQNKV